MKKTTKILLAAVVLFLTAILTFFYYLSAERVPKGIGFDLTHDATYVTTPLPAFKHLVVEIPALRGETPERLNDSPSNNNTLHLTSTRFVDTLLAKDSFSHAVEAAKTPGNKLVLLKALTKYFHTRLAGDTLHVQFDVPIAVDSLYYSYYMGATVMKNPYPVRLGDCALVLDEAPLSVRTHTLYRNLVYAGFRQDTLHVSPGTQNLILRSDTVGGLEFGPLERQLSILTTQIGRMHLDLDRSRQLYEKHQIYIDSLTTIAEEHYTGSRDRYIQMEWEHPRCIYWYPRR